MFQFKNEVTLVSYEPLKDWLVTISLTMHHDSVVVAEDRKSEIIMHKNSTRVGLTSLFTYVHCIDREKKG